MKKITLVTMSISLFSASYAQETKLMTSPVYDNIKYERMIREANPLYPINHSINSLPDDNTFGRGGNTLSVYNSGSGLFKVDGHPQNYCPNQADIKSTFPKTKLFPNYLSH